MKKLQTENKELGNLVDEIKNSFESFISRVKAAEVKARELNNEVQKSSRKQQKIEKNAAK